MGFDDLRNSRNWEDREYSICFVSRGFCNETHCIVSRFPSFAHCDEVYRGGHLFCGSFFGDCLLGGHVRGFKGGLAMRLASRVVAKRSCLRRRILSDREYGSLDHLTKTLPLGRIRLPPVLAG